MKKLILFLFISFQGFSQTINFKGKLLDKENNKPVVYANISFLKANAGISSQENGTFIIKIDKKLLNKKVHISCLNYKDTIVFAKDIHKKTLFLQPKIFELDEIVISKNKNKKIILDKVKRRVTPFHTNNIRMIGKYFPNNLDDIFYVNNVKIYFSKRNSHKAKFRIRIFSVDEKTGKPKDDIFNKNIPISIEKGEKMVELSLKNYYIDFPKNGLFIAFEKLLIPYNLYNWSNKKNKKISYYAPVIGLTKSKEFKNINRLYCFINGGWHKIPMPDNDFSFVPAISLTLSN